VSAVLAIIQNVIRTSRRERAALIFTLLLPVFLMGLFGSIFSGSGPSLKIAVVDQDHSAASAALIHLLRSQKGLSVEVGSLSHELNRLKSDDEFLVAVIPPGLHESLATGGANPAVIKTYLDRNQLQDASVAQSVLSQVVNAYAEGASGHSPAVVVRAARVNTKNVTALDWFLPSMMAYIILIAGIQTVAIALVDLRERRVLRRYLATPLSPLQVLSGQILGRALVVILQVIVLILVGTLIFHARVNGSWVLAWLCILIGTACFVSIGFLVTGFARTSETARGIGAAITFPMMFLSGIFIPLNELPSGLQNAVHVLPLTYLSDALHHVMNDGDGFRTIWVDLLVLLAWTAASVVIAARRFRWE
jgi:ABC-2 type transport system permease protein